MTPSEKIDAKLAELKDWRGDLCRQLRKLIAVTAPELHEDYKWDTAVWSGNSLVCALGVFKDHVKLNFFSGAVLPDPDHVLNSGLDSKRQRSINFFAGNPFDEAKLATLISEARMQDYRE